MITEQLIDWLIDWLTVGCYIFLHVHMHKAIQPDYMKEMWKCPCNIFHSYQGNKERSRVTTELKNIVDIYLFRNLRPIPPRSQCRIDWKKHEVWRKVFYTRSTLKVTFRSIFFFSPADSHITKPGVGIFEGIAVSDNFLTASIVH